MNREKHPELVSVLIAQLFQSDAVPEEIFGYRFAHEIRQINNSGRSKRVKLRRF